MIKRLLTIHILIIPVLLLSLILNILLYIHFSHQTKVIRVVDGDSFDLTDGRRIRLLGIDAPERDRCLSTEARNELSQWVLGKHVRLKDIVTDDYGRTLANVYTAWGTLINKQLVSKGLARFTSVASPEFEHMKSIATEAKSQHLGIWSPTCRQLTPPALCTIKGNIRAGKKTYLLSSCSNYDQAIVDLSYGDEWFCSEQAAQQAGFVKSATCL